MYTNTTEITMRPAVTWKLYNAAPYFTKSCPCPVIAQRYTLSFDGLTKKGAWCKKRKGVLLFSEPKKDS